MQFLEKLRELKKRYSNYHPLVTIVIFKDRLLSNLHVFQKANANLKIAPVLKSNAYGHGLVAVARIFDKEDIPFLVVDSLFEARQLREAGIRSNILMIGYTTAHNIKFNRLSNVAFTITSLYHLKEVADAITRLTHIHLKIDTGMHRQGIRLSEIIAALDLIKKTPLLKLEGICSHLADPLNNDSETEKQINEWNKTVSQIEPAFPRGIYKHLSATGGFKFNAEINANVARVGIGLYGYGAPESIEAQLQPTLELRTQITSLRALDPGEKIGYNYTHTVSQASIAATLPAGYYEGVDRRLSNKGFVMVNAVACPIIGLVSMNITSIDVTAAGGVKLNDPVVVISSNKNDPNTAEAIAKLCQTAVYEILVHLPAHLRRTYN